MAVQQDSLVGQKIGRYYLVALLGQGRDSVVYSATDSVLGRTVVVKILDRKVPRDPAVVEQFLRNAETLSQLRHPNILPIYGFDYWDGRAYIVRQHTDGGMLRAYLRAAGTLSVPDALALLRPIATALDYAHRQGVVHGNLRPSNILRTTTGTILLTDFAVPGQGELAASAATTIISAIDEPEYAAPEQARQQGGVPSIDLYVLGVILYESLTGRPPFQSAADGDSARNVLTRHLQAEPPAPREYNAALGPAVEATLLRALAKRPEERYPTGAALRYALHEAYEQDGGRRAGRPGTGPLGQRTLRADEPMTALPTIAAGSTAAMPGGLAPAAPFATANDTELVSGIPQAAEAPSAVAQPLAAATIVAEPLSVALVETVPLPASAPIVSRLWLVVIIGFLALCAGLACGLFFAVW